LNNTQATRLRTGARQGQLPIKDCNRIARLIVDAIDDGLEEALGKETAHALRECMSTSIALSQPTAYASALEVMVGSEKTELVLSRITSRLHTIETVSRQAAWRDFVESIAALRNRFSPETIGNAK
jgi:hypothetical protein